MQEDKKVIIWPEYFDSTLPRRLGRRVPNELAVPKPQIDEIIRACNELGLKCEAYSEKHYPRTWYKSEGMVVVWSEIKKSELIKLLAKALKKLREK